MARLTPHERVFFVACRPDAREHELATQRRLAEGLARLLGCRYAGDADPAAPAAYAVPNDTLASLEQAHRLGLHSEADLFGGVVPFPFVATKAITHPLVGPDAAAPAGWRRDFGERVRDVVLPGHTAYSSADARTAGLQLLEDGPVRIKPAAGTGGAGQSVARNAAQLEAQLGALDGVELQRHGVILERNLNEARTHSVGLLRAGDLVASYFGTQRTTRNRHGQEVYGGSDIMVVRGGFDRLVQAAGSDADALRAVSLARAYHEAALQCFAGMLASRANYDVVQGADAHGRMLAGVLESSWRIGGATGAEVAALQALVEDPSLVQVRASTTEVHDAAAPVPPRATVYFQGEDPHVGPMTKYAELHEHADTRRED